MGFFCFREKEEKQETRMLRSFKYGAGRKSLQTFKNWKIVAHDTVMVMVGKDKGKVGKVLKVDREQNKVTVEGLNLVKKHIKRSAERKGATLTKEMPLQISNVSLLDPVDGKPTRVRWHFQEDGEKVRVSKRSGAVIEKPEILKEERKAKRPEAGDKDTLEEVVQLQTFDEKSLLPPHIRKLCPEDLEIEPTEN